MSGKDAVLHYSHRFKFDENKLEYEFKMKKKHNWWWVLLFLLPLLLFIHCEKDMHVQTVEENSGIPIGNMEVSMNYTAHYLFKDGAFFCEESYFQTQTTDSVGQTTFSKLGCSVYSYIFYCLSEVQLMVKPSCHFLSMPVVKKFHFTRNVILSLPPLKTDLDIKVVDAETLDAIPEATVEYSFDNGGMQNGKDITNPNGQIWLREVLECGMVELLKASAYGYADTLIVKLDVKEAKNKVETRMLKLRPLKEHFDFFVKNKLTAQPIPDAKAVVVLTDKGTQALRGEVTTNVDGLGRGFYEDAFILAKVDIKASKLHYKKGELQGNCTVEQFNRLPDSLRVVYLEPEPYVETFRDVDTLTNQAIAGVSNEIMVKSINGNTENYTEVSNREGFFPVKAMEGDEVSIISDLTPYYKVKTIRLEKFGQAEIVYMEPDVISLSFRTVDAIDGSLLANCKLEIQSNGVYRSIPANSGSGEFAIDNLFINGDVTIVASHSGYKTNNYSIKERLVSYLMKAPQKARDIPLALDLPPCQGGNTIKNIRGQGRQINSYDLGMRGPGAFVFEYNTGDSEPDQLVIYNCPENKIAVSTPVYDTGNVCTKGATFNQEVGFIEPVVTVVAITSSETSVWNYRVNCPK